MIQQTKVILEFKEIIWKKDHFYIVKDDGKSILEFHTNLQNKHLMILLINDDEIL